MPGQGLEIVYLKDWADAFFIHVQGSGRVRLEDGSTMRLTYDAKSGLPYTGIGGLLVERGVISHGRHVDAGDPRLDGRTSARGARTHVGEPVLHLLPRS